MVKHQLLDREASPCESSKDYNFAKCIETKVVHDIGCKPHWIKNRKLESPICREKAQYHDFTKEFSRYSAWIKFKCNQNLDVLNHADTWNTGYDMVYMYRKNQDAIICR